MDQVTITLLLDYLYSKFAVTFILSIIGVVIRMIVNNVNSKQRVSTGRLIASTMFSTVLLCAIGEFVYINFSVYVLLCVIVGMWSTKLVSLVLDSKFMGKFTMKYLKRVSGTVAKSLSEALEEETESEDKKSKNEKEEQPDEENSG